MLHIIHIIKVLVLTLVAVVLVWGGLFVSRYESVVASRQGMRLQSILTRGSRIEDESAVRASFEGYRRGVLGLPALEGWIYMDGLLAQGGEAASVRLPYIASLER